MTIWFLNITCCQMIWPQNTNTCHKKFVAHRNRNGYKCTSRPYIHHMYNIHMKVNVMGLCKLGCLKNRVHK